MKLTPDQLKEIRGRADKVVPLPESWRPFMEQCTDIPDLLDHIEVLERELLGYRESTTSKLVTLSDRIAAAQCAHFIARQKEALTQPPEKSNQASETITYQWPRERPIVQIVEDYTTHQAVRLDRAGCVVLCSGDGCCYCKPGGQAGD